MHRIPCSIPDIAIITPDHSVDDRGWFAETYSINTPAYTALFPSGIQQISTSTSRVGVVRGLHCQPGMAKLMWVISGMARIINVDTRPTSLTFRKYVSIDMTADMGIGVYAPDWCARGFVAMQPNTQILYYHSAPHDPTTAVTINPFDPTLHIDWGIPLTMQPILSDKDKRAPLLDDILGQHPWLLTTPE